jgi:hypothetical protein
MIIGDFGDFGRPRVNHCQRALSVCIRQKQRRGMRAARARALCNRQLQCGAGRFHGSGLNGYDPTFTMRAGLGPVWDSNNPRYTLTEVASVTRQQSHLLSGAGKAIVVSRGGARKSRVTRDFSLLKWLRGDYR